MLVKLIQQLLIVGVCVLASANGDKLMQVFVNPCQVATGQFSYYVAVAGSEPSPKYIQCDPWGDTTFKWCPAGHYFDGISSSCVTKDKWTILSKHFPRDTDNDMGCMNGGLRFGVVFDLYTCDCFDTRFSGEHCEKPIVLFGSGISSRILTGSFSGKEYKADLALLLKNATEFDVRVELPYLSNKTYAMVDHYFDLFNDSLRYDTVLAGIITNITIDIYPDVFYFTSLLDSVNNETISEVEIAYVRIIPNLLSYAKFAFERYNRVFGQYQLVLNSLGLYVLSNCKNVHEHACLYRNLSVAILNETNGTMTMDRVAGPRVYTIHNMQDTLSNYFNPEMRNAFDLFTNLRDFERRVQVSMSENFNSLYLVAQDFSLDSDTQRLIARIQASSSKLFQALVQQSFWYLTNTFANQMPHSPTEKQFDD